MVRPKKAQLPAQAPTGLPYGVAGALKASQKELPLQAPPGPQTAPVPQAGASGLGGPTPDQRAIDVSAGIGQGAPAEPLLGGESNRPDEAVTAGLPIGAGTNAMDPLNTDAGPDLDVLAFAQYLPQMELLASSADASPQLRQLVRRVRGSLPPDYNPDPTAQKAI